ncbi:MAG TPA: TonB family protein [Polyangiaceae bacterium LLY-WYZ-15_(1-7)]|nr:hypothetical protein [Myxococcales bacterium]MAT29931.1 hypothetical protein [Sandaracinus sp.]HJL04437.1 TonB family protein [Polyangiaceae bacterium LLY-WYZ-15_(1-7)]MBJ72888.1 hypothetical protein [Sandaracinus sp.]HJL09011.1 TonB family protein [Polyangiaceae bacterium LLY-WYZ-15_(1-7)]
MKTELSFDIHEGAGPIRTERFARDVVKIGRLPSSHLRLDDADVSRMHAVVEVTGDAVHVIDLGSASGTFVNGQRINKARLEDGDELRLGGARLVLRLAPVVATGAPSPAAAKAVPNPFAAPVPPPTPAAAEPEPTPDPDAVRYGVVASGPPVSPAEVEAPEEAYEVVLQWGESVLHVEHVPPGARFVVGEAEGADYLIGADVLGAPALTLVEGGQVSVPANAEGAEPGTRALGPDGDVSWSLGGFRFRVKRVHAGKRIAGGTPIDRRPFMYVGGVMALAAGVLTLFSLLPPKSSALAIDNLNRDSRLVSYLMEPPAFEEEEQVELEVDGPVAEAGGSGERHAGEEGEMGDESAPETDNRYAVEGPENNPDPHLARESAREEARNAGVLGTLRTVAGSWNTPTSPFGRETALGQDPMSYLGALMGSQPGENHGLGGLGLRGTGRGAGGDGLGTVGLDTMGTLGHGAGVTCDPGQTCEGNGYGRVGGIGGRDHVSRVPRLTPGPVTTNGGLSREVIRRTVRRHHNEVKFCYEQSLRARPDLEGRVTTRFIISQTGAVTVATVQSSTLGHSDTEACITQAVRRWAFPAPDGGGIVSVTYPFMLRNQ